MIWLAALLACDPALPEGAPAPRVRVDGRLVDATGAPAAGERIMVCNLLACQSGLSGPDGRFDLSLGRAGHYVLKTEDVISGRSRHAAAMLPVLALRDAPVDVGDLPLPPLPEGPRVGPASADPQALAATDDLTLTISRSAVKMAFHDYLHELVAVPLPPERTRWAADLTGEDLLAVWALHPFEATSAVPVAIAWTTDQPDGAVVRFRTVGGANGTLSAPIDAPVSGGVARTPEGAGITELTYLVATRP